MQRKVLFEQEEIAKRNLITYLIRRHYMLFKCVETYFNNCIRLFKVI